MATLFNGFNFNEFKLILQVKSCINRSHAFKILIWIDRLEF